MGSIMENRRLDLLNRLEAAAKKTRLERDLVSLLEDFSSLSFQTMYGLPAELQLRAALHMCERYMPISEKKWPGVTWPRELLGDLDAWFRAEGEGTPDGLDDLDSADRIYQSGFTNLLVGYHYRDDPACLTAGVCGTIIHVVHARAQNVFLTDDPVVVRLQKEEEAWWSTWGGVDEELWPPRPDAMRQLVQPEHSAFNNVAFDAVYRREWRHAAEWLRGEAVWKYPEPDNLDAMMRGLQRWQGRELCPMGPERGDEPEGGLITGIE